jgi:LmbE family N-acetylglucosaminyl deacetylase
MGNLKSNKKILIIAAHPDDEVLGCGGSIIKLKKNCTINTIFMTNGISSRNNSNKKKIIERRNQAINLFKYLNISKPIFLNFPDNQMDKIPLLKIVKKIEKYLKFYKPDAVFTHYENCLNIDHKKTFEAVITACRPLKNISVKKILSFEIPSSTDWNLNKNKTFVPNYFIDISKEINEKLKAVKFYKSELKKYPHSRSLKSIKSLAAFRGTNSGVKFAEGFYLNRYVEE